VYQVSNRLTCSLCMGLGFGPLSPCYYSPDDLFYDSHDLGMMSPFTSWHRDCCALKSLRSCLVRTVMFKEHSVGLSLDFPHGFDAAFDKLLCHLLPLRLRTPLERFSYCAMCVAKARSLLTYTEWITDRTVCSVDYSC